MPRALRRSLSGRQSPATYFCNVLLDGFLSHEGPETGRLSISPLAPYVNGVASEHATFES